MNSQAQEKITLADSMAASLKSALLILKFVLPFSLLADLLLHFRLLAPLGVLFAPVTDWLGLPPEAAMAVAAGMLLNLYAAIALAAPLGLDPWQWTVLAVFLGVCHSLPVESAIMKQLGIALLYSVLLRVSMACVSVLPLLALDHGLAGTVTAAAVPVSATLYPDLAALLRGSLINAVILSARVILLITGIIVVMDRVRNMAWMHRWLGRIDSGFSLVAGQLLGITYGAGILLRERIEGRLSRRATVFVGTFLLVCHAVIEDTLLFVLFGASGLLIVATRGIMAVAISCLVLAVYINWLEKRRNFGP